MRPAGCVLGCRLCLRDDSRSNYFSLEEEQEFLVVSTTLGLAADFSKLQLQPNHMCGECRSFILQIREFKEKVASIERMLVEEQDRVRELGLEWARERAKEGHMEEAKVEKEDEICEIFDHVEEEDTTVKEETYEEEDMISYSKEEIPDRDTFDDNQMDV